MVSEADVRLADGRTLHAYDTRADGIAGSPGAPGPAVAVFWLHGSPNIGSPPEPLFASLARRPRPRVTFLTIAGGPKVVAAPRDQ